MESKIKIFESGINDGIMSRNKKFYKKDTPPEEINELFLKTRIRLGEKYNFDGRKMFQAHQKTELDPINYPDGKYIVLNDSHMQKEDYWYEDLPADILILEEKYKNIVVGNQMADCPIIIAEDRKLGVTALSHCGSTYINRHLPEQTIDALLNQYHSNVKDIYVYIGSSIKKDSYIYDTYPTWATDEELWKDCIEKKEGKYSIDIIKAIVEQLESKGIVNIKISPKDTYTSPDLYSYRLYSKDEKVKKGQNFVGFYYK